VNERGNAAFQPRLLSRENLDISRGITSAFQKHALRRTSKRRIVFFKFLFALVLPLNLPSKRRSRRVYECRSSRACVIAKHATCLLRAISYYESNSRIATILASTLMKTVICSTYRSRGSRKIEKRMSVLYVPVVRRCEILR